MSHYIRQGSNQTQRLDRVLADEVVSIQGSNGEVIIDGDVWGRITVQGSNPEVTIGGVIKAGAVVTLQGSNGELTHNGRESGARVTLQGSNSEENDRSRKSKKPPPDRSGLEFGTRFPPNLFASSSSSIGSLNITGVKSGKILIDGVDVTELLTDKPKVKATDVPPTTGKGNVTVQKSHRPRELWGT